MLRELIAPAQEQVAFHAFERLSLPADHVRVRSLYGAAKHGTEMALYKGYAGPARRLRSRVSSFYPRTLTRAVPAALGQYVRGRSHRSGYGCQ